MRVNEKQLRSCSSFSSVFLRIHDAHHGVHAQAWWDIRLSESRYMKYRLANGSVAVDDVMRRHDLRFARTMYRIILLIQRNGQFSFSLSLSLFLSHAFACIRVSTFPSFYTLHLPDRQRSLFAAACFARLIVSSTRDEQQKYKNVIIPMLICDPVLLVARDTHECPTFRLAKGSRFFSHGTLSPFRVFTGKLSRRYIFLMVLLFIVRIFTRR